MWRRLILLGVLLLAPTAIAASFTGELVAKGTVQFPTASTFTSTPLALFTPDAAGALVLTLDAENLHVQVYEKKYVTLDTPVLQPSVNTTDDHPSWDLSQAHATLSAGHGGWLGLRPSSGTLTERLLVPTSITSVTRPKLGNADTPSETDDSRPAFLAQPDGDTLLRNYTDWDYVGSGNLKIMGPTVTIASRENTTTIQTGQFQDPNAPGQLTRRWLILSFPNGTATQRGATSTIASASLIVTSDGALQIQNAFGSITSGLRAYDATGQPTSLDGTFTSHITAKPDAMDLQLDGNFRSTTLAATVAAPGSNSNSTILIFVVGITVGGVGAAYALKKRRVTTSYTAEEHVQLAEAAADNEDYARAAEHTRLARKASPTSRRLAIDHSFFVAQAGDPEEGIRLLQDPIVADDPDALVLLARLELGQRNEDAAARALTRALEVAPIMLLDVTGDPDLVALFPRDEVKEAIRNARHSIE